MAKRYDIPDHPTIANMMRYGEPYPRQIKAIYICSECAGMIYEEDLFYRVMGETFCESCMDGMREYAAAVEP
jgi:formylmethanofuran dehydrogenase subunit E